MLVLQFVPQGNLKNYLRGMKTADNVRNELYLVRELNVNHCLVTSQAYFVHKYPCLSLYICNAIELNTAPHNVYVRVVLSLYTRDESSCVCARSGWNGSVWASLSVLSLIPHTYIYWTYAYNTINSCTINIQYIILMCMYCMQPSKITDSNNSNTPL